MKKLWYTYDDIHRVIQKVADKINQSGQQFDAMIAIGGGGFIPARILRSYLDIPIYTVSIAYYDENDQPTEHPYKLQWLDGSTAKQLAGKNILVVDEVDDSRVTLSFCLKELQHAGIERLGVAVLHEKIKEKSAALPEGIPYFSGITVEDLWIDYPWDATDIDAHNREAEAGRH